MMRTPIGAMLRSTILKRLKPVRLFLISEQFASMALRLSMENLLKGTVKTSLREQVNGQLLKT